MGIAVRDGWAPSPLLGTGVHNFMMPDNCTGKEVGDELGFGSGI